MAHETRLWKESSRIPRERYAWRRVDRGQARSVFRALLALYRKAGA